MADSRRGRKIGRHVRRALIRLAALLSVAVIPAYVFLVAPSLNRLQAASAGPTGHPSPPAVASPSPPKASPSASVPASFPPAGSAFIGVSVSQIPRNQGDVTRFRTATGYAPRVIQFARGFARDRFDPTVFAQVARQGAMPMLSWEPWDHTLRSADGRNASTQPTYRLNRITQGAFDSYISSYANGIKALGYPVAVRFAHEMNGAWYPWCEQANGNHPGDYVRAYRHVREIFKALGVTNAVWVWSPNALYPGASPLAPLYPGDDVVDWIGLSGYNGINETVYRNFDQVFAETISVLRQIARKPIVLTEIGATNRTNQLGRWITEMFRSLPNYPDIIGVVWYEVVKDQDWRVVSSTEAIHAFAAGAVQARYQVTWDPSATPLVTLPPPTPATPTASARKPTPTTSARRPTPTTSARKPTGR